MLEIKLSYLLSYLILSYLIYVQKCTAHYLQFYML